MRGRPDPFADPFAVLGLPPDATDDDVRRARRRLATGAHPDVGGDDATMSRINAAAEHALELIAGADDGGRDDARSRSGTDRSPRRDRTASWTGDDVRRTDVPSFVVEALPAVAFEALTLAASELGEIADDDPPYRLWALLDDPACWCRVDVVPDAGASTVSLAIAPADALDRIGRAPLPTVESVRDRWIVALNALDWSTL